MANFAPKIVSPCGRPKLLAGALEAAGQSYVEGNFVKWVSGLITEATPGDSIIGLAKKTASTVTSTATVVEQIEPGDLVVLSTVDSNDSNNAVDAATFEQGDAYGMLNLSSVHCADIYDTTNKDLIFLRAVANVNGDTSYRGVFRIPVANSALVTPA